MSRYRIAPSLLSADLLNLNDEIDQLIQAGSDELHIDVMDGHFVPNLTFGPPLIKGIKARKSIPLDVHIMIANPQESASAYLKAGADCLSFHIEATHEHQAIIREIRRHRARAGIAISPATPISRLLPLLQHIDKVLVMSVEPGFGGQAFLPASLQKIAELRELLAKHKLEKQVTIAVDGGITNETIAQVAACGARSFVVGSYLFAAPDRRKALDTLRSVLAQLEGER